MLPNWLYGKSKSKLASILGGGGGAPADYDQVKAQVTQNTEDILLLSDALDDKAALTQITNRNLLDNPWFTINQRLQSSYTELNKYTVDRWRTEGDSTDFSVDVVSDGVQLKRNVSEGYIALGQLNESTLLISGKEYTLSVLYSDGTIKFNTFTVPAYEQSYLRITSTQSHMGCQAMIDRTSGGLYSTFILYDGDISTSPTIRAVKLEVGEVSTLGMDIAPNYEIELSKCKRYFQRFKFTTGALIGIGFTQWAQGIRFILPYTEMRTTTPQLIVTSSATKIGYTPAGSAAATAVSAVSIAYVCNGLITLQATVSDLTPGTVYAMVNMDSDTMFIDFSAEL